MNKKAVVLSVSAVAVICFLPWAITLPALPKPAPQEQATLDSLDAVIPKAPLTLLPSPQQEAQVKVAKAEVVALSTPTQKTANPSTISKSEFGQTYNGMTPEQVVVIVGGPGEMVAELGTPGNRGYTVTYKYIGEGSLGAKASMMFQNGKLYMKAQYGLN